MALELAIRAKPSLSIEGLWDSNVFNVSGGDSDYLIRATPELSLGFLFRGTAIRLTGRIEAERYAEHEELNKVSATKYFNLTPEKPIPVSQRFTIRPSAVYIETEDLARRNVIVGAPSGGDSLTPVPVLPRGKTRELAGSMQVTYLATQTLNVSVEAGGRRQDVEFGTSTAGDSKSWYGSVATYYRVTPRFSIGPSGEARRTTTSLNEDIRILTPAVTGKYLITPTSELEATAGASYIEETRPANLPETSRTWKPTGKLDFRYRGTKVTASLTGQYEPAGSGDFGLHAEKGSVRLSVIDQWTPLVAVDLSGYYATSRFKLGGDTEDTVVLGGTAAIRYQAASWISFRLAGSSLRQWQHNPVFAFEDLERHSVLLGFQVAKEFILLQ